MAGRRGAALLILLLLVLLGYSWSRRIAPSGAGTPAFFIPPRGQGIIVACADGFPRRGIHHFSDGDTPSAVISVTIGSAESLDKPLRGDLSTPLQSGEVLALRTSEDGASLELKRSYLPAKQRILLGIPLHPRRMTASDWQDLPGVGTKLAAAIELERQKNGEFVSLDDLRRVRGIGAGRIDAWRHYFADTGK